MSLASAVVAQRNYDESEDRGDAAERERIAAERRADTERDRADAAEREVARLRLQLKDS